MKIAESYSSDNYTEKITKEQIDEIVQAAVLAPSGGNAQPWKFVYRNERLFIFHDLHASYSFLDFKNLGSYVAIGASIENIKVKCRALGLEALIDYKPMEDNSALVAVVGFKKNDAQYSNGLGKAIYIRLTNRNIADRELVDEKEYAELKDSLKEYNGATLDVVDEWNAMQELGDILATTEKLALIHPRGHFDAFKKELRWSEEENKEKRDGLDVATLGITKGEIAALRIAYDADAIHFVRDAINGGNAFKKMAQKAVRASSALGIISMPEYSGKHFLLGGEAIERVWLEANLRNISVQPITQFTFLLARLVHGNEEGFDSFYKQEFNDLKQRFFKLLPHLENKQPVFTFRLCKAEEPLVKSLRKPLDAVFFNA